MATTAAPTSQTALKRTVTEIKAPAPGRLTSLDVFRGMTIAGMILVNNPGDWGAIYWPLRHAEWNGWTPTDLVFPFFLFIVGVSMAFSFASRQARGDTRSLLLRHTLQRALIIFAIGFFLAAFPYFRLSTVRIPGVLQRIAVVYLLASAISLWTDWRGRLATAVVLLGIYWAAMTLIPVPGFGAGNLSPDGNLAAFIDRKLLYEHLWVTHRWDPEGLLSTLPAVATCLFGMLTGQWLRSARSAKRKVLAMLGAGIAGLAVGKLWHLSFPINKSLWTSSYVVFTAGFALVILGTCYWLIDMRGWRAWGKPFQMMGMNPLTLYALSSFIGKCSIVFKTNDSGQTVIWKAYVYEHLFAHRAQPIHASLLFAVTYVLIFLILGWVMYRRRIFLKV